MYYINNQHLLEFASWVVRWQFVLPMGKLATLCQNLIRNFSIGNCIWFEIIFNLNLHFWRVFFKGIYSHPFNFLGSILPPFKILYLPGLFIFVITILKILLEAVNFYTHVSCVYGQFRNRELNLHEIITFP